MTLRELIKTKAIIRTIAREEGKAPGEIRRAMQEALDAAWTVGRTPGNIRVQLAWQRLFPDGKPTVEEFILRLAEEAKQ